MDAISTNPHPGKAPGQLSRSEGHEGEVGSAAVSPDGTRIVTASVDDTARVWWADGIGEPLVLKGHEDSLAIER